MENADDSREIIENLAEQLKEILKMDLYDYKRGCQSWLDTYNELLDLEAYTDELYNFVIEQWIKKKQPVTIGNKGVWYACYEVAKTKESQLIQIVDDYGVYEKKWERYL